jgi:fucose permease
MVTDPTVAPRPTADRARRAVGWVFAINGLTFASWASRLPAVRDGLGLNPGDLGLVIFSLSLGAVLALPLSGLVVHRLGPAASVRLTVVVAEVGLATVGLARVVPVLVAGLFTLGVASGIWDVAMNVEGAAVERLVDRPIMPRFHAAFSLGTVVGAGLGAGAAALGLPVREHLVAVALANLVAAMVVVSAFLPPALHRSVVADTSPGPAQGSGLPGPAAETGPVALADRRRGSGSLAAWGERRTLALGLVVLGMAFCEGSANDWLAVGLVDGYRVDHALGAVGYGVFVTAMTVARMIGPTLLRRWGRVRVLRGSGLLALAGIGLVVGASTLEPAVGTVAALLLAAVGALAWGGGSAMGFPVGMSAASDEPDRAPARVGVVATIGYTGFIAGPPLLGRLADQVGILRSLLAVSVAVAVALVTAGAARAPDGESA